jgi:hypothetical protein
MSHSLWRRVTWSRQTDLITDMQVHMLVVESESLAKVFAEIPRLSATNSNMPVNIR